MWLSTANLFAEGKTVGVWLMWRMRNIVNLSTSGTSWPGMVLFFVGTWMGCWLLVQNTPPRLDWDDRSDPLWSLPFATVTGTQGCLCQASGTCRLSRSWYRRSSSLQYIICRCWYLWWQALKVWQCVMCYTFWFTLLIPPFVIAYSGNGTVFLEYGHYTTHLAIFASPFFFQ